MNFRAWAAIAAAVAGPSFLLCGCSHEAPPIPPGYVFPCSEEMPEGFTYIDRVAPLVRVDLKYAGYDNFVGRPLDGYKGVRGILRTQAALKLKAASEWLDKRGYYLLVYDAYRPHTAMIDINKWGHDAGDRKMKSRYYPKIDKERIFKDLYLREFSEHSRGVAVDVTLVNKGSGKPVDMGGHFDLMDPVSATDSPLVTDQQRRNRMLLKQAMNMQGFVNYAPEWWHYRMEPEPDITAHFSFPVCDGMK